MGGTEIINQREEELVLEVIRSKKIFRYAYGENDKTNSFAWRFEKEFATRLGSGYASAVSSGSAALLCGLRALEIKPGTEVIMPAYTFAATAEAIVEAGATPVLAEIDESLNVDPADLALQVTEKTSAIIPVHMMGASADMEAIMEIAREYRLPVLEDACQAIGATWRGRHVGTTGNAGTFSFDSAKLLTCGEGGMLVTNDRLVYENADRYHDHGHVHDLSLPRGREAKKGHGFNFRLSEIQAAFGLAQLEKLPSMLESLRRNRDALKERLSLAGGFQYRQPSDAEGENATFLCLMAPTGEKAEKTKRLLAEEGVPPATLNYWHYKVNRDIAGKSFPRTEECLSRAIVFEVRINMDGQTMDRISNALNRAMKS